MRPTGVKHVDMFVTKAVVCVEMGDTSGTPRAPGVAETLLVGYKKDCIPDLCFNTLFSNNNFSKTLQLKISCIKTTTAEDAPGGEEGSEKLRRVADKIPALQREIVIKMRIRDGMERMISAKNALTGSFRNNKPTPQELEMTALMKKSNKKLDILKHGLQKCNVQLAALTGGDSPVHHTSSHDDVDAKRIQRQKQVTHELLETEQDYATDLKHIVILFLRPLTMSGNMSEADARQVFSNINQIAEPHEGLAADMGRCKADPGAGKPDQAVLAVHNLLRQPAQPKTHAASPEGLAGQTPASGHALPDSAEAAAVALVNEAVRKRDAEFRIHLTDERMDFGGVVDKFKLADGRRELVSEKPSTCLKKHAKGSSASVDVLALVFTDMVLIRREKKNGKIVLYKPPIPFEAAIFLDKPDRPFYERLPGRAPAARDAHPAGPVRIRQEQVARRDERAAGRVLR
ncbi:hypothetical protein SeLEV6574_g08467 [Synchytrium endobioticum]|uniref:DH domain-containing protein n=1 Tax=Synchytrium endobioticum TaxID=286115 RepID=A0A507BZ25_9FUNG|nr:hypothetical protein SeLEV6574_g08467 [Synchytrium endobioticum]